MQKAFVTNLESVGVKTIFEQISLKIDLIVEAIHIFWFKEVIGAAYYKLPIYM